jgi:hypothetical protein
MTPDETNKMVDTIEQLFIERFAAEALLQEYMPEPLTAIRERAAKIPADAMVHLCFRPYRRQILEASQQAHALGLLLKATDEVVRRQKECVLELVSQKD